MFYSKGKATFQSATQTGIPHGSLEIVIQEVLWSIRGSYTAIWSLPLTNVKCDSDPWPGTVILQSIRPSTNFMTTLPSLPFTEQRVVSKEHLLRARHASRGHSPFGPWFRPPYLGLASALIVQTGFSELAASFLGFSPWVTECDCLH